ncbi:four helix bundle protein [Hymenobacter sp. BT186]|uniref:Four helix bundle protein n=1 Tax=Hymenobacter telluris TaxID=2816474 RepID=A0A939EVF9_9BACT|nr:four helix bundle protein [Hymenobacter telluris]MBO0357741.1 four helix bundle protein [Hymenobacter telluris]MBW3373768.1 four helix bundle protein [Hymenobacter norwichensis]
MKQDNAVLIKSYAFAVRIVRLYKHLRQQSEVLPLAAHVLRSGTSIGANVEEAVGGFSRRDFVAKCSIAYKEARETHFWLRLLRDTDCLEKKLADSLLEEADELKKLLAKIILSSRQSPDTTKKGE